MKLLQHVNTMDVENVAFFTSKIFEEVCGKNVVRASLSAGSTAQGGKAGLWCDGGGR